MTASLLSVRGGPVRACRFILLSLPPAGCSGVEVRGVDIREIPEAHAYPNGTIQTPHVRLVGTWDGSVLTVTRHGWHLPSVTGWLQPVR